MKRYKTNVRKLAAIMNGLQLSLLGVLFFLIVAFPVFCTATDQGPQPLNVLIFSGQNNHNWQSTTPVLKKMYEECDRFAVVDVTDEPGSCTAETFAKYDVIVSNWTEYPDTKRTWPEQTEKAFMDFVNNGGGFVVFHASSCSFQQWPEFQNLVGITWQADHTAHGAYHTFKVTIENKEHPVTRGMDDFYHTDELYHNMVTLAKPDMKVLCKAFSAKDKAGTDKFEPVLVSTKLGKGRGLNLVLGHDAAAMQNIGYQTLMLRGAEWAATGEVTTVIPDFWPVTAGAEAVLRNDFDTVLDAALGYQHGQDRKPLAAIERLVRYATSADCEPTCSAIADKLAAKMADILASKATVDCKKFLCKQLAIIGTREQIPVLESLLTDELLSFMARYALEGIEGAEADKALRGFVRLLDKVQGRSDEEMAKLLGEALKVASRTDGKKALFGALSHHKSLATMQLAQVYLKDSNLVNEASTAVINIAEAIKGSHSKEVKLAMQQVLANSKEVETNDKANTILLEVSKALDLPAEAAPGDDQSVSRPPVSKKPSYAQIMEHNGTPTLFLNDQPVNYSGTWVFGPSNPNWGADCTISLLASNTDTHIYAFEAGTGGPAPQWCGPGSGYSGDFDFSKVKPTFERIIDVDPHAFFHLRVHLEIISEWWCKAYPEECEVTSLGRQPRQSYASKVWRTQAIDFLSAFISHIKSIGMLDRVIAFQVGGGHTGEWVKRRSSMAAPCGDYSEPMRQHFRAYLSKKYNNDISALRNAWNNPEIAFDTVEVPSAREQLHAKNFIFRDPSSERNVIDYFQCLAELCSDVIIDYCKTVKEETNGKCLAGAFYGYLMELSWNSGFFAEWPDRWSESDYSTTQRSGHLGLDKIFDSPYIDFLVSPYSYGFRGIGGESPSMIPVESARLHDKFIIVEDDIRLHGDTYHARYGQAKNLQESITLLKRNFNQYVTHGQGYWRTATDNKKLYPVLKQLNEIGTFALQTDRTPIAEIAVLLDDESFYFETVKNNLDVPLIFRQKQEGLVRFGAIFNTYLLDDFIKGRVQPHKLYIFLNSFRIDSARREKLKSELQRDGRIAVWLYAPGYIKDDLSMENMRDLTGFKFAMSRQPWGASMHIVNFNHPITSGIPQDLFWGTNNLLSPVFYLEDPDALELGQVVHAQGRCVPGMGVKVFREWTSIFVSAPNIPAPVLRGLARFAKVHLYNEEGDVLNATKHLLGVHTVSGGKRIFKLPNKVQEVYDLYNNKSIASNTDQFQVILLPKSTSLYYTGDTSLLAKL